MFFKSNSLGIINCACRKNATGEFFGQFCEEFKSNTNVGSRIFGALVGLTALFGSIYWVVTYCNRRGQALLEKKNIEKVTNAQRGNHGK